MSYAKDKKTLDDLFSIFIRRRHADSEGYVKCFTCGKIAKWKEMQCGHFQSRVKLATRWDEINCQVQCVACNIFGEGNKPAFAGNLVEKFGINILQDLEMKSFNKFDRGMIGILIKLYQKKLKVYET